MCVPGLIGALGAGGAATAAGATAAASTLSAVGTLVSIGGSLISGIQGMQAGRAQAAAIESQRQTEARLTAAQDQRTRSKFASKIAEQRAELAARGVQLDSPTAVALGETAARELSFESQSIRSGGQARDIELSAEARLARSRGASAMMKGVFSAANSFLSAPPDTWSAFKRQLA